MHEARLAFAKINSERNEIINKENEEKAALERKRDEKDQIEISKIPDNTPDWKKKQMAEKRDQQRKIEQERDLKKFKVYFHISIYLWPFSFLFCRNWMPRDRL